ESTVAPHLPNLSQQSGGKALAARAAAEHDDVATEKPSASGEIHRRFAAQARAVEKDRPERQKFESGVGADRQGLPDNRRRSRRTVVCARGGAGARRRRAGGERDAKTKRAAGAGPAGGGKENRQWRIAEGGGREQNAQRVALIEVREVADTVADGETDLRDAL